VFTSAGGSRLNDGNVRRRVLKPAAVRAGLLSSEAGWKDPREPESWVAFHTFRHTCASLLFEGGKNVRQVAAWLSHADPSFTLKTYVHLMDDGVGGAAFMDAAVVAAAPESVTAGVAAPRLATLLNRDGCDEKADHRVEPPGADQRVAEKAN
jgi:hypothetical protein